MEDTAPSIIVTAYNSSRTLERCLKAIDANRPAGSRVIVVDDGSEDSSCEIAERLADEVVRHERNLGRTFARLSGINRVDTEWCIIVDSDVVVAKETFPHLRAFASARPWLTAVSGLFSAGPGDHGFATEYKNLYMNFTFQRCPEEVTFIFGSICMIKTGAARAYYESEVRLLLRADDTAAGQALISLGHRLGLCKDAEVLHLKTYTLLSLLLNDFLIPFDWSRIFFQYGGLRQLFRKGTGFAHSSSRQLMSIILACAVTLLAAVFLLHAGAVPLACIGLALWILLSVPFAAFIYKKKGAVFLLNSFPFTFLDHLVMASGIVAGLCFEACSLVRRRRCRATPIDEAR